ncbi:uncharacterized protein SPSK_09533 [Sporothrix schenckii 1099-18]|uniref:YebC/PmpR family DNA-binding regulatory protein n=2 Tax=Sporothrix schenckii TaxID=29908 RepID=U7PZR0_SPOS1|nr:uncharacterized protein SPSK_09533 [Sporothrix schenckii 1099-18]ERS99945.1 hypothetical protein HMPREF1624_03314 [Sporothrix schenckii ATCC 58251]KJR85646.1 hypothetical protein SPSK_09533 [Sporothrix schenckii 1099-18]
MPPISPSLASLRAAPSPWTRYACAQCCRSFGSSPVVASGHNRWSKIRHEKGAADIKKTQLRSNFTKTITLYSQMYGPDVNMNPQLASVVSSAKKSGVPKAVIEAAIARGQGKSADGGRLESATYEIMMPPSVALIVDLETESKARALQELNSVIRRKGGTMAPTKFFFTRQGRVILGPAASATASTSEGESTGEDVAPVSVDDILEDAIEAGAEDVETNEDGNIVVWTAPLHTGPVVTAVEEGRFKVKNLAVLSADTVWSANEETQAPLGDGTGNSAVENRKLLELVAAFRAYPDVKGIFSNVTQGRAPDDVWQQLVQDLDW